MYTLWFKPIFNPKKLIKFIYLDYIVDAAPEAVKRKAEEVVEGDAAVADEIAPTPEKKTKVDEAVSNNGDAEVVA